MKYGDLFHTSYIMRTYIVHMTYMDLFDTVFDG